MLTLMQQWQVLALVRPRVALALVGIVERFLAKALERSAGAVIVFAVCSLSACGPSGDRIGRGDFGEDRWPFTVGEGVLRCRRGAVTFEANHRRYAVNGTAKQLGHPDIEPIWKNSPTIPGTKVSIAPVLERGLRLCPP